MNHVKWEISIAGIPVVVGSTWSDQGNAALWLQQIYVIIFEVDIVAEQKQTFISHNLSDFIIFHCPNFLLLPILHHCLAIPVHQLPDLLHCTLSVTVLTNVLKNSFGMILKVFLTNQEKIMAWPE